MSGEVWLKYQVAQFSRVLGTLLIGGIPLMQALETAADSLGTQVLEKRAAAGRRSWCAKASRCRNPCADQDFPSLSIDMIEVGESTGALPAMLASVAEFYEDDVSTRITASLEADRAGHHDLHGHLRRIRADFAVSADLLAGRFDARVRGGKLSIFARFCRPARHIQWRPSAAGRSVSANVDLKDHGGK